MKHQSPSVGESRLERGKRALADIDGEAGHNVIAALADIAPDFANYIFEFPFGNIYCRPGLDLRAREVATIAALTAMGTATPQLKVHIAAGLNVGLTKDEITEVIMQMAMRAFLQRSTACSPPRRSLLLGVRARTGNRTMVVGVAR